MWLNLSKAATITATSSDDKANIISSNIILKNGWNLIRPLSKNKIISLSRYVNNLTYYLAYKKQLAKKTLKIKIAIYDRDAMGWLLSESGFNTYKMQELDSISKDSGVWMYFEGLNNDTNIGDLDDFIFSNHTPARDISQLNIQKVYTYLNERLNNRVNSIKAIRNNSKYANFPYLTLEQKIFFNTSLEIIINTLSSKHTLATRESVLRNIASTIASNFSISRGISDVFSSSFLEKVISNYANVDIGYAKTLHYAIDKMSKIEVDIKRDGELTNIEATSMVLKKLINHDGAIASQKALSVLNVDKLYKEVQKQPVNLKFETIDHMDIAKKATQLVASYDELKQNLIRAGISSSSISEDKINDFIQKQAYDPNTLSSIFGVSVNNISKPNLSYVIPFSQADSDILSASASTVSSSGGSSGGGGSGGGSSGGRGGGGGPPPPAPIVHNLDLLLKNDTGISSSDKITKDTNLTFIWNAVPNANVYSIKIDTKEYNLTNTATSHTQNLLIEGNHTIVLKALDNSNVTLKTESIIVKIDTTVPTVVFSPLNNAVDVRETTDLNLSFSEKLDETSLDNINMYFSDRTNQIGYTLNKINDLNFSIHPAYSLSFAQNYDLNISMIRDIAGNVITPINTTFSTRAKPTVATPTGLKLSPLDDSGVTNDFITSVRLPVFQWNAVNAATAYRLSTNYGVSWRYTKDTNYSGAVLYEGNNTIYLKALKDSFESNETNITVVLDTKKPKIVDIQPISSSSYVDIDSNITINFNERILANTISQANVKLMLNNQNVSIAITNTNTSITINPNKALRYNQSYVIMIKNIEDVAGNVIESANYAFTTNSPSFISPPKNLELNTSSDSGKYNDDNITNVKMPKFTWDKNTSVYMYEISFDNGLSWNETNESFFTPDFNLTDGKKTVLLRNVVGLTKSEEINMSLVVDTVAPIVQTTIPDKDSDHISADTNITVTFYENVEINTSDKFSLFLNDFNSTVYGNITNANNSISLDPSVELKNNTEYNITVSHIKDIAGNELEKNITITFESGSPDSVNAPTNIDINESYDSGRYDYDNLTNIRDLTITWDKEPYAEYRISLNGGSTVFVSLDNNFSPSDKTSKLQEGKNNITIESIVGSTRSPISSIVVTYDSIAPFIKSSYPQNGQIDINATNATIRIELSEKLDDNYTNSNTTKLTLYDNDHKKEINTLYVLLDNNTTIIMEHYQRLVYDTNHSIILNNAVDMAGNKMDKNLSVSFITESPDYINMPTNFEINSSDDSGMFNFDGVTNNKRPLFLWNDLNDSNNYPIEEFNISFNGGQDWINLKTSTNTSSPTYITDSNYSYRPNFDLSEGFHRVELVAIAGKTISPIKELNLTIDTISPLIVKITPNDNNSSVDASLGKLIIQFDSAVDINSVNETTISLIANLQNVQGNITTSDNTTIIYDTEVSFIYGEHYDVLINNIRDIAGNEINSSFSSSFDTSSPSLTPPVPQNLRLDESNDSGLFTNDRVTNLKRPWIIWDEVTSTRIYGYQVRVNSIINNVVRGKYQLQNDLQEGNNTISVRSYVGNTQSNWENLIITLDTTPPNVTSVIPFSAQHVFNIGNNVVITFNENIDLSSVNATTIALYKGATKMNYTLVTTATSTNNIALDVGSLAYSTDYQFVISGIKDITGNFMTNAYTFGFTTQYDPSLPTGALAESKKLLTFNAIRLTNQREDQIKGPLNLYTKGVGNVTIVWSSDKPNFINPNGTVTQPEFKDSNESVVLDANLSLTVVVGKDAQGNNIYQTTKDTKRFNLVVQEKDADLFTTYDASKNNGYGIYNLAKPSYDFNYELNLGATTKDVYIVFTNTNSAISANSPVARSYSVKGNYYNPIPSNIQNFNPFDKLVLKKDLPFAPSASTVAKNFVVGDEHNFTNMQGVDGDIQASLKKVITHNGKTLEMWIRNMDFNDTGGQTCGTSHNNDCVTMAMIDTLADKFLNANKTGIYSMVTSLFGEEWGTTKYTNVIGVNNHIAILLTDIANDGDPILAGSRVLGYYWAVHNFARATYPYSDEMLLFNIDAPLYARGGTSRDNIISTLAHEFQHMVHFYQKTMANSKTNQNSPAWINEMMSMVTEDLLDANLSSGGALDRLATYNNKHYIDVTTWNTTGNVLDSYAISYSLGAYLLRSYGVDFFRYVLESNSTDEGALIYALEKVGKIGTFGDILKNWGKAVLFSDKTNVPSDYRYNIGADFTFMDTVHKASFKYPSIDLMNGYGGVKFFDANNPISGTIGAGTSPHSNAFYHIGNKTGRVKIKISAHQGIDVSVIAK